MPYRMKIFALLFVVIPDFGTSLFVTWTGAKFLALTNNMGTLILKAFGLAYIVQIDELLFASFASQKIKQLVQKSRVTIQIRHSDTVTWDLWLSSMVRITCAFLSAIGFS